MGFFLAKGFLNANQDIPLLPNLRVSVRNAIWAGENIEPRILEVLPAAIVRLPRHFDLSKVTHPALYATVEKLKRQDAEGEPLWGIPYRKLKRWLDLPLPDGRLKPLGDRRVTMTFRLRPASITRLKRRARELGCTATEALERALAGE